MQNFGILRLLLRGAEREGRPSSTCAEPSAATPSGSCAPRGAGAACGPANPAGSIILSMPPAPRGRDRIRHHGSLNLSFGTENFSSYFLSYATLCWGVV